MSLDVFFKTFTRIDSPGCKNVSARAEFCMAVLARRKVKYVSE